MKTSINFVRDTYNNVLTDIATITVYRKRQQSGTKQMSLASYKTIRPCYNLRTEEGNSSSCMK